jgi:hypothetical protein
MHRSGTSCLTGSLQQAGLELGEVHTWNRYNRRGNREKQSIVDLNDALLKDSGGAWDQPPAAVQWSEQRVAEARDLLAALGEAQIVGFKDPRTLITADGWRRVAPELEFVGVFRHPHAVASSLAHRSGMPTDRALALWYDYNCCLLSLQRELRFPLVNFDLGPSAYLDTVARVADALGLDGAAAREAPFFDETLRSAQTAPARRSLPYRLKLLHWRLCRRAIT